MEDISNICRSVKPLGTSVNGGGIDEVQCGVAYSCRSITAVFHTVINDSHSQRLAAQGGGENQNLDEVENLCGGGRGGGGLDETKQWEAEV